MYVYQSGLTISVRNTKFVPYQHQAWLYNSCVDVSSQVSYKTLRVYLTAIRLEHLEQGFTDPTNDEVLQLVYRGIWRQQGDDNCHHRLPVTINLLRTLKTQLSRSTSYTVLEQHLLWAAFALAFYGLVNLHHLWFQMISLLWVFIGLTCNFASLQSQLHYTNQKQILFEGVILSPLQLPIHLLARYMPCIIISTLYLQLTNQVHSSVVVDFLLSLVSM